MGELRDLLAKLFEDPFAKLIYVVITVFSAFANYSQAKIVTRLRGELERREEELTRLKKAIEDSEGNVWNAYDPKPPEDHQRRISERKPLIITIANLKGGVGKSTLTANLGCYFHSQGKNVLLIDLDYQGSLSSILFNTSNKIDQKCTHNISNALKYGSNANTLLNNAIEIKNNSPRFDFLSTFYEFLKEENQMQLRWLLGEEKDDIRFRLSKVLLNDVIRARYDVVLIDTPPRPTTGMVNALCASSYFLVPTVLDNSSAEAVRYFLQVVQNNFKPLNPALDLLGIVGTMTQQQNNLHHWEQKAIERIHDEMIWVPMRGVFNRHIPHKAAISKAAGQGFVFNTDEDVKRWFEELGREIEQQIYGTRPEPLHAATAAK